MAKIKTMRLSALCWKIGKGIIVMKTMNDLIPDTVSIKEKDYKVISFDFATDAITLEKL